MTNENSEPTTSVDRVVMRPCPFCGCEEVDPEFWMTTSGCGPGCTKCSATAEDVASWNRRAKDATRDNAVVIWKSPGKIPRLVRCNESASDMADKIREVQRLYPDAAMLVAYTMYPCMIEVDCIDTILAIEDAERLATGEQE